MKSTLVPALAAILALAGCSGPDPTKIKFADNAANAVVLLRVEPIGIDYDLNLMSYDEATHALQIHLFTDAIRFHVSGSAQPGYVALTAPPGTYVFQDVVQQKIWGLCFNNASRSFTIHPSEAVFLGDFQPRIHIAQLEKLAVQHGDTTGRIGVSMNDYFDPEILPPQVTTPGPNTPDFLAAKRYEAEFMPTLKGRLKPVEYHPAKFGVGYVYTGQRVCGGLFKEDVK